MSKRKLTKLERFEAVLETHGADFSSWPLEMRELRTLIKGNERAAQLYEEAKALDQLLGCVGPVELDGHSTKGLQQKIMADFEALPASPGGEILAFPQHGKAGFQKTSQKADWGLVGALAACFILGLYLGGFGIGDWRLDPASSLASLSDRSEQSVEIANDVFSVGLGEEIL